MTFHGPSSSQSLAGLEDRHSLSMPRTHQPPFRIKDTSLAAQHINIAAPIDTAGPRSDERTATPSTVVLVRLAAHQPLHPNLVALHLFEHRHHGLLALQRRLLRFHFIHLYLIPESVASALDQPGTHLLQLGEIIAVAYIPVP